MRVLGLDLGTASLGWALMEWGSNDTGQAPSQIVDSGVRIFPEGVKKTKTGEESLSAERRRKRSLRRQIDRRARRRKKIFWKLYYLGLLPNLEEINLFESKGIECSLSKNRPQYFSKLDSILFSEWKLRCEQNSNLWHFLKVGATPNGDPKEIAEFNHRLAIRLPYLIRSVAASEFVSSYSLGRAIAQLATRRGFLSNRKIDNNIENKTEKDTKDDSKLKERQGHLYSRLRQSEKTLGQFLANQEPIEQKLRKIPTTRAMFKEEFDAIRKAQKNNPYLQLKEKDWEDLRKLIFFQRPLKSQRHLRSKCSLEKNRECCPKARLVAQEFRLRTALLNLKYRDDNYEEFSLTNDQLNICFNHVWQGKKLNSKNFKSILELPNKYKWNFDTEEAKSLSSPSVEKIVTALKEEENGSEFWNSVNQYEFVDEILSYEHQEALAKFLFKKYSHDKNNKITLSIKQCDALSQLNFEENFFSYSSKALNKLLPYLRQWRRIDKPLEQEEILFDGRLLKAGQSIRNFFYPEKHSVFNTLLPLQSIVGIVRNPVVTRSLSQLRSVVNAIILRHGLPDFIRVELAREVKKTSKEREKIRQKNNQRESTREKIKNKLKQDCQIQEPKPWDIEKYLLWIECAERCPYTGKTIPITSLFNHEFEVEHIIPLSRGGLEDSYANKTLCHASANKRKGNKTPFEAFGHDSEHWNEILTRISKWKEHDSDLLKGYSWGREEKLRRFRDIKHPSLDSFIARQLTDTQYSSKLARKYLSSLYENPKYVQVSHGTLTSVLRKVTGISGLLGEKENGKKSRADHRHHVIDAMMVAMSTPARVKALADLVEKSETQSQRPWKDLKKNLEETTNMLIDGVQKTRISFAQKQRTRGSFHLDNPYGTRIFQGEKIAVRSKEVDIQNFQSKSNDISSILDIQLGKFILGKNFETEERTDIEGEKLKVLIGPNQKPIHKLKMREKNLDAKLRLNERNNGKNNEKILDNDENHHIEIWATQNKKGVVKWEGRVMNMLEACIRKSKKQPIYKTLGRVDETFVMTLHKNDLIECDATIAKGRSTAKEAAVWRVDGFTSVGQLQLQRKEDSSTRAASKSLWQPKAEGLQKANSRRIFLDVLGYPILKKEPKNE
ncbi:MAG: type II CRISPR RNA-guided endonuclease Cas9 [Bdellovibrionota bacterium]